jgi:hypothetical protein
MARKKLKGRYPKVKSSQFGLKPTKGKPGKYPVNTRGRAISAKGRAKQQLKRGRISKSQYSTIVAKANKKLGKGKKRGRKGGRRKK